MSKWIAEFELEDGDTMPEHMDLNYRGARIDFYCRPLEQEPKTDRDCISRQAVLNLSRIKTHNEWGNVIKESVDVEDVKQLPPVNPQELKTDNDCISRQEVNKLYDEYRPRLATHVSEFGDKLKALSPVTPTRRKGKWIEHFERDDYNDYEDEYYECSICHTLEGSPHYNFCPNCGAKMSEVSE